MMFWNDSHTVWWQIALMWVGMIAFWGAVIWAGYALYTNAGRKTGRQPDDDAHRILDRRLAQGEIDADEYRRLADLLAYNDHPTAGTGSARR